MIPRIVRRRILALAATGLVASGIVAGAQGSPSALSYLRLSAGGTFAYQLDYGSHPDSVFNGKFYRELSWVVNAIAVYDGRTVWIPKGLAVVHGGAYVDEERTKWARPERVPVQCANYSRHTGAPGEQTAVFSAGRLSISNRGMKLDPGPAVEWNIGCNATESLPTHGLPGGPQFMLPAPGRSRFGGAQSFSIACRDDYSHPYDKPGLSHGHAFTGSVVFWARFTPFPAAKLDATKKRLRDKVGKAPTSSGGAPSKLKACP